MSCGVNFLVCFHFFSAWEPENFAHKLTWEGKIGAKNKWWQEWQECRNSVSALSFELFKNFLLSLILFSLLFSHSLSLSHTHTPCTNISKSPKNFFKDILQIAYTHTSILIHSVSPRILSSLCPCLTESRYKKIYRNSQFAISHQTTHLSISVPCLWEWPISDAS